RAWCLASPRGSSTRESAPSVPLPPCSERRLAVRALRRDLAVAQREHVEAVDVEALAAARGARRAPLHDRVLGAHEVAQLVPPDVGDVAEVLLDAGPHRGRADVAMAPRLGPERRLEDAVVGHES